MKHCCSVGKRGLIFFYKFKTKQTLGFSVLKLVRFALLYLSKKNSKFTCYVKLQPQVIFF
ncbi:MAG: hypothetical protein ACJA17_001314 [Polaribacter sp.]|jgi:hypothetical protein